MYGGSLSEAALVRVDALVTSHWYVYISMYLKGVGGGGEKENEGDCRLA